MWARNPYWKPSRIEFSGPPAPASTRYGAIGNGIWGIIDSKRKAEVEEEDSRSSVGTWENDTSVVVYPARKGAA